MCEAKMLVTTFYDATVSSATRFACGAYKTVRITAIDKPVFVKFGGSAVDASAGDGSELVTVYHPLTYVTGPAQTHVSVIEQAATAIVTVAILE